MPWVRIDENAMDHPKIGALPDGAFRLWVQGLAYCQKHLTDGCISTAAIRALLAFSPKRRTILETAGLWDRTEYGIQVHDYLVWNDSRAEVMQSRQASKERKRRWREGHASGDGNGTHSGTRDGTRASLCGVGCSEEGSTAAESRKAGSRERSMIPDDPLSQIAWLQERYADLHLEVIGVGYIGNAQADYREWCGLLPTFGADLLEKLMVYWFHTDDEFTRAGTRTVAKFRSRASKYAEELKAKKLA